MQIETFFRTLLPLLILGFALHRGYYVRNHSRPEEATLQISSAAVPPKAK